MRHQPTERWLWLAGGLSAGLLLVEIIGGVVTSSLALLAIAAHSVCTLVALASAVVAMRTGRGPSHRRCSVAHHRFAILKAAGNAMLLCALVGFILYEADRRLALSPQLDVAGILVIALLGLLLGMVSMQLLRAGGDSQPDLKAAQVATWNDLLGSAGVIAGAIAIRFTAWTWIDALLAVAFSLWAVVRAWRLLQGAVNLLLERVPENIDSANLRDALLAIPGVKSVHDLRAWANASGNISLTVHVVHSPEQPATLMQTAIQRMLAGQFAITDVTVQCELTPCHQTDQLHRFLRRSADGKPHQRHAGHGH